MTRRPKSDKIGFYSLAIGSINGVLSKGLYEFTIGAPLTVHIYGGGFDAGGVIVPNIERMLDPWLAMAVASEYKALSPSPKAMEEAYSRWLKKAHFSVHPVNVNNDISHEELLKNFSKTGDTERQLMMMARHYLNTFRNEIGAIALEIEKEEKRPAEPAKPDRHLVTMDLVTPVWSATIATVADVLYTSSKNLVIEAITPILSAMSERYGEKMCNYSMSYEARSTYAQQHVDVSTLFVALHRDDFKVRVLSEVPLHHNSRAQSLQQHQAAEAVIVEQLKQSNESAVFTLFQKWQESRNTLHENGVMH